MPIDWNGRRHGRCWRIGGPGRRGRRGSFWDSSTIYFPIVNGLSSPSVHSERSFFSPDVVRHGSLSILAAASCCLVAVLTGRVDGSRGAVGFGRSGRSLEEVPPVLVEVVDTGDDFEDVTDLGDGPITGGDGVEMVSVLWRWSLW